jgi:hypothetical protein
MVPREHDRFHFGVRDGGSPPSYPGHDLGNAVAPETNVARLGVAEPGSGTGLARAGGASALDLAGPPRRNGWTYLSNAAIHPSNLLLLIGVMFLSLILWSGPVLFAGLGVEAAFLAVVPRCAFFRRSVDACLDEAERAVAQKAHEALVLQMGEAHRQELSKIEVLIGKIFTNAQRRHGVSLFATTDPLGMGRLTGSYIRLAIAHRACEESLAMTNRHVLEGTIRSLEAAESASPDRSRALLRRRLSIAYRRAECWARTRDNLESIGHQLATITELVYLMHQESLAPSGSAGVSAEVDRVLTDFEHGEGALRELADIGVDEGFEAHELAPDSAAIARRA